MARPLSLLGCALLALAVLAPDSGAAALIAPERACPGQGRLGAPARAQQRAMGCMTNFARRRAGLPAYRLRRVLDRSARLKSRDILRCGEFSHQACGRDFTFWMQRAGYLRGGCWRAAENIAVGTGSYATVRSIFRGWMHSPGHRRNILGSLHDLGVGMRVGMLDGHRGAHVWTQQFGMRC